MHHPHDAHVAFSIYNMAQSTGLSVVYFYSSALAVRALICYIVVEIRLRRTSKNDDKLHVLSKLRRGTLS